MPDNRGRDKRIIKAEYKRAIRDLEVSLGGLQRDAFESGVPVVIVFEDLDT